METFDHNGITLHRWRCGAATFVARPELGARLMQWTLRMADGASREILYWPEAADFNNFAKIRGGNPILFPFSARTFHKGTLGRWKDAASVVRPMPQHGFTRNGAFSITALDDTGFTAQLEPDDAAREGYPFDYRFSVQYIFDTLSVKVLLKLENLGDQPILWSAGHHFYFTLPWHPGFTRDDYRFEIPAKKCFTHASNGALQPVRPFGPQGSFGDPENSDRIFTRLNGAQAVFGPKGGEESIGIRILEEYDTFSTWNAFVTWTETEDSPFYCVEPWMGPPNSPEHHKGLHAVSCGTTATFGVEVALL